MHVAAEADGGGDHLVVRPVGDGLQHRETAPVDRPAVGVDVDGDVGARC